ncbi:MAG: tetratricopeptide repeat protein [Dechloromonas sp.]|uniref:Tetratricopeptide repeat protein n=1 Tax=Candidatus Dechloromonas phosphorivorans TaxID=2899244 RepID=A0A9D7LQL4_9RHOO|nr:tetratricopeptide repeat protein [Candidatus Dechloromonas phosphorivorans]
MFQFSFDVSIEEFEAKVIEPSSRVPVVIDFWAPWCEPCKTIKPLLEKLAEEYAGRFLLAKVDADQNPELAQHFGVRSIPRSRCSSRGNWSTSSMASCRRARSVPSSTASPCPLPAATCAQEAAALVAEGRLDEALARLSEASREQPADEAVRLDAIDVLLQLGRNDEAGQLLASEYTLEADRANALRARLALAACAADTGELEVKLAANPADHATRLDLARAYAGQSRFREALENALEVVVSDRFFDEGAGRKALLQIFEALAGSEQYDDLVREFRRKLSAALN